MTNKIYLICGALSSIWYMAINAIIPLYYDGYDFTIHTVSELSAIGAPTRTAWVGWCVGYVFLFGMFGIGILRTAKGDRRLQVLGRLVIGYTIFNFYWPPMHQRGTETSLTDMLHLVWASITTVLMILIMAYGAATQGRRFKLYTIITAVLLLTFGFLTSLDAPKIPDNLATPLLGIWERIMITLFMLWVIVLSFILVKKESNATSTNLT